MGSVFITSIVELLDIVGLSLSDAPYTIDTNSLFPLLVSGEYAALIAKNDWFDPLLLQVIPQCVESSETSGFSDDAVEDRRFLTQPGIVKKYRGRALLLPCGTCSIHCRYCLRRFSSHTLYPQTDEEWSSLWCTVETAADIRELILSGGDPLMMENGFLEDLFTRSGRNPAIDTVRIHTRVPISLPGRIDESLCQILSRNRGRKKIIIVIHTNHPREIGSRSVEVLNALHREGVLLLNQSVLLAGINDSSDILEELSRKLVAASVMPYYLHQLDKVSGTAHFEVSESKGAALIGEIRRRLPGYAVPRYVREIPGADSKTPLCC